ncbi:MAG: zf-TFIIB domain-containing protein [Elusimicrobia bacterium]|nr:zf-TFIIB domain-containing protein [Elusimicrobiota bacterium]
MTEAAALRCPSCGAPVAAEAPECGHCRAALHPVRCPWCFDWTFAEARDCARCGSRAEAPDLKASCPSCREPLSSRSLGSARLSGCARCGGVWADPASFRAICEEREAQAAYLGEGSVLKAPAASDPLASPIVYRPCPVCAELMNRFNFAGCSGVILDACKPHGIWFDVDELRRIAAFIRGGGLDVARGKEKRRLELERRRLERGADDSERALRGFREMTPLSIGASRGLLRFLLEP